MTISRLKICGSVWGHARTPAMIAASLLLALAVVSSARAQSATATLAGTLTDEAGAVVPTVQITALNLGTALQRHAQTDAGGSFTIPLLPPGRYALTARREGFATIEVRNVALHVNDQKVLRIRLRVGEVGETVTVNWESAGDYELPSVSTVVDRRFVENLPLNGRSFHSLIELTPGTVLTRASFSEQGQFSVNGQRPNANYFTVDGVSANFGVSAGAAPGQAARGGLPALTVLGGTNNLVSVEALEEFRVHTSSYAPEFGRTPGAQVSLVTRAGTNDLRGSLFEYLRHDALDANDWFANRGGLPKPALRQSDFGGALGGPVIRDRVFFFSSYEGLRLRQPQVAITEVPSRAARAAAPANVRPFLNAFPIPNGPDGAGGFAEFSASYSDQSRLDSASIRVDAIANDRLTIFGRYSHSPSVTAQRAVTVQPGFAIFDTPSQTVALSLNTLSHASMRTRALTLGASYVLGVSVVNDLRVNWSQAEGSSRFSIDDFGGAAPPSLSFLQPPSAPGITEAAFQLLLQGGLNAGLASGKNAENEQRQFNLVETLSLVRGWHHIKIGFDYRMLWSVYDPARYSQSIVYNGVVGPLPGNALSGVSRSVSVFAGGDAREPVFTNFSAYAQDTWHVGSRLTLTYGLRWEVNPPPSEANGNHPHVVRDLDDPISITLAPPGTPLWETALNNFAPRVGAAYRIDDARGGWVVLRGGLGLFYDLGNGQAAQGFGSVPPYVTARRLRNVVFPLAPELAAPPRPDPSQPLGPISAFDPGLRLPRTYQWNLSAAKSLGAAQTLSAGYVGAAGRALLREDALISPDGAFSLIRLTTNGAESSYHALQAQWARRLSRGVQAAASYTWSKSIDTASSDSLSRVRPGGTAEHNPRPGPPDLIVASARGPSDFDLRHSFVAAASYNLPRPRASGAVDAALRGWSVDAIFRARTAAPLNIVTQTETVGDGLILELQRPDLVAGVPLYLRDPEAPGQRRVNREAFRTPPTGRQGTLGYNALRGFPMSQLDLALRRRVALSERLSLQLRAEVFNLLNHPNFANPVNNLDSNSFGLATQTLARGLGVGGVNGGLSPLYQLGGPRSAQLTAKLLF